MTLKINYDSSSEIGTYFKLTNTYCIVPDSLSKKTLFRIKSELGENFPIIFSNILGANCQGRLIACNSKGILLPSKTSPVEFANIKNTVPENVVVRYSDDNLTALGNCVATNDFSALMSPDLSKKTEELLCDTLGVEVFKSYMGPFSLVGSYCVFNNQRGLIHPDISCEEQDFFSELLQIPLRTATVNRGSENLGSGIITNDYYSFCGQKTTQSELHIIDTWLHKKISE
jgi:translation initiation factor 6